MDNTSKPEEIDKLLDSTIKLVMVKPSIEEVTNLLKPLMSCMCCK
jgi:hypothetical protein